MQKKPLVALMAATAILAGCGEATNAQKGGQAPLVVTQDVAIIDYQPSKSYIGRIEAVEDTNITAQVSGYLEARHFDEGQMVEKGQLLYSLSLIHI